MAKFQLDRKGASILSNRKQFILHIPQLLCPKHLIVCDGPSEEAAERWDRRSATLRKRRLLRVEMMST